ncbi:MAG: ATP-binding protein [Ruminiclostridium sp.]|nr:ATP-binding protein [Ruminiclostridium sp.]
MKDRVISGEKRVDAAQKKLIKESLFHIAVSNMFILVATCACGVIDNLFISRILGPEALAAVGFFSPVTVAVGFSYIMILGTQVLAGNFIGAGRNDKVNRLFISSFLTITVFFIVFTILCMCFASRLGELLGVKGAVNDAMCEYIMGYCPGIVPQTLVALLMALCSLNNELKRSYVSIGVMIVGNVVLDWLLVKDFGLFGIGIASTVGSFVSLAVLLPGFFGADRLFHFQLKDKFSMKLVLSAAKRGLPSLMFSVGVIIKNYCFNYSLSQYTGEIGVAAAGILSSVCAFAGAIPAGFANAFSTLASIYYGEQDRGSYIYLSRITLRMGLICCTAAVGAFMITSPILALIFAPGDEQLRSVSQRMFLLGFTFLIPNLVYNVLLNSYRAQNRMLLINIMSFAETAAIGLFVLLTVGSFGADAAWLANTIVDILCILVIIASVFYYRKKPDLSLSALLKLPDSFGVSEKDCFVYAIEDAEQVVEASSAAIKFCMDHGYKRRLSTHVGLCIEEMAYNVLKHGFGNRSGRYADIRVAASEDGLTVRIRDNCREFDPRKRMEIHSSKDKASNFGIRIVAGQADTIEYYNNAGINTLIMRFLKET